MSDFVGRVRQVWQSCIWPVQKIILNKNNFSKNLVFCMFLGLTGENFLIRHNRVCSLLTRVSFPIMELNFEIFFPQFRIFSSVSGFQFELLPYWAQKFRHSRQEFILRVQTKVWWKIGLRLESVTVSIKILTLHKNLSNFWWKISARSPGLHLSYTRARFEKITIVSKKLVFLSLWDLEWRGKKFDFWQLFVRTVVETLFWVSRTTIWFFLNNFYQLILSEIRAGIVETF